MTTTDKNRDRRARRLFRAAAEALSLDQQGLARALGVTRQTAAKLMDGQASTRDELAVEALCRRAGVWPLS